MGQPRYRRESVRRRWLRGGSIWLSIPTARTARVHARIRYKDVGGPASIRRLDDGRVRVDFESERRAMTPGQSVVFYEEEDIVGGGIIDTVEE